jgi:zinc transport system substrate-binding protein
MLTLSLAACGTASGSGANGRTTVAAAFYPLAYAAEQIGGGHVSVTNLTPAGAEPHDLELTPRDVERIRSSDVVLYLGSGFQPAVEQAAEGASGRTIDLLAGGSLRAAPAGSEESLSADPHVWLDPLRYAAIARRIATVLGRPRRGEAFVGRLRRLDREYRRGLLTCRRHDIVTSHAAFGYLAARYGLRQVPISGLAPEVEPAAATLEHVIDEVRSSGATTVFFETLVSPRLAETVARETHAQTAVLDPLEGLTKDELSRGEDYFSIMRKNLSALRLALGCR